MYIFFLKSFKPTLNKSHDKWLISFPLVTASSTTTTTNNHLDDHNDGHNDGCGYHDSNSSSSSVNGNGSNSSSNWVPAAQAREATCLELLVCFFILFFSFHFTTLMII
jgi:hypothetical protein